MLLKEFNTHRKLIIINQILFICFQWKMIETHRKFSTFILMQKAFFRDCIKGRNRIKISAPLRCLLEESHWLDYISVLASAWTPSEVTMWETVISFFVSVPVLSQQITFTQPELYKIRIKFSNSPKRDMKNQLQTLVLPYFVPLSSYIQKSIDRLWLMVGFLAF